jgi:hypothetical protein
MKDIPQSAQKMEYRSLPSFAVNAFLFPLRETGFFVLFSFTLSGF